MKYAIIENNVVINVIMADDQFIANSGLSAMPIGEEEFVFIGQEVVDGQLVPPPQPEVVGLPPAEEDPPIES